jgi:hypothetical protein
MFGNSSFFNVWLFLFSNLTNAGRTSLIFGWIVSLKSGYLDLIFDGDGVMDEVVTQVFIVELFDTTGNGS